MDSYSPHYTSTSWISSFGLSCDRAYISEVLTSAYFAGFGTGILVLREGRRSKGAPAGDAGDVRTGTVVLQAMSALVGGS